MQFSGGGKDLETAASFPQNAATIKVESGVGSTTTIINGAKINIPSLAALNATATSATSKTVPMFKPQHQPMRFPKVNTANNRVPVGTSSGATKPRKYYFYYKKRDEIFTIILCVKMLL